MRPLASAVGLAVFHLNLLGPAVIAAAAASSTKDPSLFDVDHGFHAADVEYENGPSGPDVEVDRDLIGDMPYGIRIESCQNPGEVAITFDDGPYEWTRNIAEAFDDAGFKATFFIAGFNAWRKIYDTSTQYPKLVRDIYAAGHQIGSHTWTHKSLERVGKEKRIRQILDNEKAFNKVLGVIPTYMRPPFGECYEDCQQDLKKLGYHLIWWDIDTKDYMYNSEDSYNEAIDRFDEDLDDGGSIALCHDIKYYTAHKLVPHMISELKRRELKGVTVGQCLGDPEENWYRPVLNN
ncbi:hypothetical protein JX265_011677 [Neoarthrinium moseri]|uniref:NodB homology domain-containing protein n=1 Tax=Neoarthrinium moseri TaxID=1658444 RepID=A0A9Q0AKE1_9PEZI|nr:uncharacterized protein JN550_013169 [Neoarthrinium moseri]KAI1845567.1 hypothetical protein JX266_008425 [Neoarthrinium moseri]KAI1856430.1 hypothetical protein JX265_011677 [Neoarthrinium moseri]KAI1857536.1 hypothetical protein JN550_013169 [Neoarthrinium moseri]